MLDSEETWMAQGSCRRYPELGWIRDSADVGLGEVSTMSVICGACPVVGECAGFALRKHITSGFWAGEHRDVDATENYGGAA